MTTYSSDLGAGRSVTIGNDGTQTVITLVSIGPGQQQSQRSGFTTGQWLGPPVLFQTAAAGIVLRIDGEQGCFFVRLDAQGISVLEAAPPTLVGAEVLPLR